jgi:inorganic pyrophosphatase
MNLKDLPIGDQAPDVIRAIIEIPKGSRTEYEYDEQLQLFRLDRILYSSIHYPQAYGFVPHTLSDDNDALDVIVLTDEELAIGVLLDVRPIGLLVMKDEKGTNSKVLSIAAKDPRFAEFKDVIDVPNHVLLEIEHFFRTYTHLEEKDAKVFGWNPAQVARFVITRAMKEYDKRKSIS